MDAGSEWLVEEVLSRRFPPIGEEREGMVGIRKPKEVFWSFLGIMQALSQTTGKADIALDTGMPRRWTDDDLKRIPGDFDFSNGLPKCDWAEH
jgi:hypothetical protein